ncbi:unnamed protein product [Pylaiella littoralis]
MTAVLLLSLSNFFSCAFHRLTHHVSMVSRFRFVQKLKTGSALAEGNYILSVSKNILGRRQWRQDVRYIVLCWWLRSRWTRRRATISRDTWLVIKRESKATAAAL